MKRIITFLVLLFGVLSSLMAQKANLYLVGQLSSWQFEEAYQFSSADDDYFVLSFPEGQELELTGLFKVASSGWSPHNYGAPAGVSVSVEVDKEYTLELYSSTNLNVADIIQVSKIEFTVSTQTLKITGATQEKVFDTTTDYGFYIAADYKDYPFTFKGNGVYEYDYTGSALSATIGDYQYKTVEWGRNGTSSEVTLAEPYPLAITNLSIKFPQTAPGQTLTIVLTVLSDWSATILVKEKSSGDVDPVVPTVEYVVAGNGTDDLTATWVNGEFWDSTSKTNVMAGPNANGDYTKTYAAVPAGNWNFRIVERDNKGNVEWSTPSQFDAAHSSANISIAEGGNVQFALLQPADVTITYNAYTRKFTATTPSGSFDKTSIEYFSLKLSDDTPCTAQNTFSAANNNQLTFKDEFIGIEGHPENVTILKTYTIVGNCKYVVYEKRLQVQQTEGTYNITITFNGDYENPEFSIQAEKIETPVVPPVNPDPVYSEIWLSGQVTGYQRLDEWKFTSNDGDNYVIDFATPTELTSLFYLFGKGDEPIVENPGGEPFYIFAADAITNIEANKTYTLVGNGSNAIGVQGIIEATRIEFQLSTATFKVIGTSKAKVFDVTKDYNLCINFNPEMPMTFKGNGVYTGTYVVSADATGYKTAFNFGDVNNAVVAVGSTDPLLYNVAIPLSTTYNSLVTQHVCNGGDKFECTLTFKSDWTASVVVSYIPNLEGRTYTVRGNGSSDPTGVWCGGIEWADDDSPVNIMTDADKDGIYQVTYKNVPAGSYAFKVVGSVESWMGGNYLDFDNSSMGVKEEDMLYDDDGDGNIMFTLNQAADVTIQYNVYTGKIIVTTPSGSFGKPKLEYFHIHDQCEPEDAFTEANNYTLTFQKGVMVNENGNAKVGCIIIGNCDYTVYRKYFSTTVTESGTYNVTVTFNGDYENPDFTVTAVKVESADAIPVYIMGGFNNWKANEDYKLTSTDGDYYVATYPAGSELKIEGGFKLGSADNWESIDLGAAYPDMQIEPGYEFTLSRGGANIIPAGVLLVSKIELVLSEGLLKITGTAVQDIFDVTQDVGIALVEFTGSNPDVTQTFMPLTFKGNGVYQGDYIYAGATDVRFKVGGKESLAMIDFGNGSESYLSLDVPFTLKRGAKPDVEISPADIEAQNVEEGDTFAVTVTITADWQATLLLQKTASAPKPVISNLNVPAFAQIEVGNTATVTATYTLENATKATASVEAPFYILNQSVKNGVGSIELVFMPETSGTYNGTLTITSGKTTLSKTITAVAVDPKPEVVPVIKNLQVPAFASTYVDETSVVTATYTLENATEAKASISGTDAGSFIIVEQTVGSVKIMFIPQTVGTHQATLTITSGLVTQSASIVAVAVEPKPVVVPVIKNLQVPAFASTYVDESSVVTATYTLENATEAKASISGTDAGSFIIVEQTLGSVKIMFIPQAAGTHQATLTITSGNVTQSASLIATAVASVPDPQVVISNLVVPTFATVEQGKNAKVIATFNVENTTDVVAQLTGADAEVFVLGKVNVSNEQGSVQIVFIPETAGTYNATLTLRAGNATSSVNFSATAIAPKPVVSITNINVPAFPEVYEGGYAMVDITYTLINASNALVTVSNDDIFILQNQKVQNGKGSAELLFAPDKAGLYNAVLTIEADGVSESVNVVAVAKVENAVEPDMQVSISDVQVPAFESITEKQTTKVVASYVLKGTEDAVVTLSGNDAQNGFFTILSQSVSEGIGRVEIEFAPNAQGVFNATLTISAGGETASVGFSATALPAPVITLQNEPTFTNTYVGEKQTELVSYTLQHATQATATLAGDVDVFTLSYQELSNGNGLIRIDFEPETVGTYTATLLITSGVTTKRVTISATAVAAPAPKPDPVININPVPDFGAVYVNETAQVVATYTLQNATEATASLSENKVFSIVRTLKGAVIIKFTPTEAGTYYDKLIITAGKVSRSVNVVATAIAAPAPEPEPVININPVPDFGTVYVNETAQVVATYTLQNATAATAIISGDKEFSIVRTLKGAVLIKFAPTAKGTYKGKLTITSGKVSQSISFSATAIEQVTPEEPEDPNAALYVDLGLPSETLWAKANLGADTPQDFGDYYAWAELDPKEAYNRETYKWYVGNKLVKYCTSSLYGTVDENIYLDILDDAAQHKLGKGWHVPSVVQAQELVDECTWEFTTQNDVKGYVVTGPNGNSIFLPSAGEVNDVTTSVGNGGSYWLNAIDDSHSTYAKMIVFSLTYYKVDANSRTVGRSIRPVFNVDEVSVEEVLDNAHIYAKDGTIYADCDITIYTVTGLDVTHQNGWLEGVYIVKTENGNVLLSVW